MSGNDAHLRSSAVGSFSGRVGHKAGGFIAKKFFHPSNMKNQEKLWQALEAKKSNEKRQQDLLKKREDEKRAEAIQNQMSGDLASYVPSTVFQSSSSFKDPKTEKRARPDLDAEMQTKKRLAIIESEASTDAHTKIIMKSRYEEDIHEKDHSAVWGSYFDVSSKCWGYKCCHQTDKNLECTQPHL